MTKVKAQTETGSVKSNTKELCTISRHFKTNTEYMDPKLSHCLSAYQKNNGCESTILWLVENWKKDMDCKRVVESEQRYQI